MGKNTKIQWATATWNPFIGCTKVSQGCDNCYAERGVTRWGKDFKKVVRSRATFNTPFKWKKAERIFVCSWSDFFHADILRADRHLAIKVMRDAPQHIYMLLTKRPENILPMLAGTAWAERIPGNVWVGVTAENQETANKRIPILLQVPAEVRFISCEPLLGPISLLEAILSGHGYSRDTGFHWVICGGESGTAARPTNPIWFLNLRDECIGAGTPFFFKQWGEWHPDGSGVNKRYGAAVFGEQVMRRVGKARTGRILNGREWNEIPYQSRVCRVCGCTEEQACLGGCEWVKPDLCSTCIPDGCQD